MSRPKWEPESKAFVRDGGEVTPEVLEAAILFGEQMEKDLRVALDAVRGVVAAGKAGRTDIDTPKLTPAQAELVETLVVSGRYLARKLAEERN